MTCRDGPCRARHRPTRRARPMSSVCIDRTDGCCMSADSVVRGPVDGQDRAECHRCGCAVSCRSELRRSPSGPSRCTTHWPARPNRPVSCHGWIEVTTSGRAVTACAIRATRSGAGRTSASTNRRIGALDSAAPNAHACGLPSHPGGSGGGVMTRAPCSVATLAVASSE